MLAMAAWLSLNKLAKTVKHLANLYEKKDSNDIVKYNMSKKATAKERRLQKYLVMNRTN